MANGICKVTLVGNLGADPEMRYSQAGKPVTTFRVACNSRKRTKEGEWQDHTEWFRVSVFGPLAERMSETLHRGSRVYVEGRLETSVWESQNGPRFSLEVIGNDVLSLDPRPRAEGDAPPVRAASSGGAMLEEPDTLDDVPF